MPSENLYVGIDVSKHNLGVAVCPTHERRRVCNDDDGIASRITRLQRLGPALIVLEAKAATKSRGPSLWWPLNYLWP
jgi:hypothetical protein